MDGFLKEIMAELKANADPHYRDRVQRYFKESVKVLGVRFPVVRGIARESFKRISDLGKQKVFEMCGQLLEQRCVECDAIAFQWAFGMRKEYEERDFFLFEKWLKKHVSNWASCDDFCTRAFSEILARFPCLLPSVKKWVFSKNIWVRRASAVIMIPAARKEMRLEDAFGICSALLLDKEDLVQKGYGWLLKEISNRQQERVFEFVMERKGRMPRTALRFAIEKMPPSMRKRAMAK